MNKIQMIFQEIGGEWLSVDSAECKPPTLADGKETIEYKAYGTKARLNITQSKKQ